MAVISIIMATYNRGHLITETLESIKNQTLQDFECLIIDDGSTDDTQEIVSSFTQKDNRFSYQKRPDKHQKGLPGSRNYGLSISQGELTLFFDDDDIMHPENLETCHQVLKSDELEFFRYGKKTFTDSFDYQFDSISNLDLKFTDKSHLFNFVSHNISMASPTVMWKSKVFDQHIYKEDLMYAEEWEVYSRIIASGARGAVSDVPLYYARKHASSNTGEFWNNNPVRVKSNEDAHRYLYDFLSQQGKIDVQMGDFFLSATRTLDMPDLRETILTDHRIPAAVLKHLKKRNRLFPIRKALYKLKKKI
jgi:glycosyltransferase involved in cell wall biosynthesis